MKLGLMLEMYRAFVRGAPLGDVTLLKFAAFRAPPGDINERLGAFRGHASAFSRPALEGMPPGSFGRAYASHLEANHLEHLSISPALLERFADNPYAIRYTQTHDFHHVLTGFDTGVAGEIGVLAFMVGQGVAPVSRTTLSALRWVYPLASPTQAQAIRHDMALGLAMGERAVLLLAEPLEDSLPMPLESVRERLRVRPADVAAIRPSGPSVLADWLYRARPGADRRPARGRRRAGPPRP